MQSKPSPLRDNIGRSPIAVSPIISPLGSRLPRTNSGRLMMQPQRDTELEDLRNQVDLLTMKNEELQEKNLDLQKQLGIVGVERGVRMSSLRNQRGQMIDGRRKNQGEGSDQMMMMSTPSDLDQRNLNPRRQSLVFDSSSSSDNDDTKLNKGGMKLKMNTSRKIKRKKGRKSQNKRRKPRRGSKKRHKRPHRNTRKKALKIEH